jgi:hypothetical protein
LGGAGRGYKMKKRWAVVLLVLGIFGVLQYFYFQFFSTLALDYHYTTYPDPEFGKFGLMHIETTVTRNWSVGIVPAIVGVIFVLIGGLKLGKNKGAESKSDAVSR